MRLAAGAWSSIPTSAGRGAQRCEPWVPRTGRARPWLSLLLLGSLWSWGGAGNPAQLGSLLDPSAWGLQAAVLSQLLRCSESKARRRAGPGGGLQGGREGCGGSRAPSSVCCSSYRAGGSVGCVAGWAPLVPAVGCRARHGARGTHSTVLLARAQAPVGVCRPQVQDSKP